MWVADVAAAAVVAVGVVEGVAEEEGRRRWWRGAGGGFGSANYGAVLESCCRCLLLERSDKDVPGRRLGR